MTEPCSDNRPGPGAPVLRCDELPAGALQSLFARYGLEVCTGPAGGPIPGSYWGEPEAGLRGNVLHIRPDTPVHSALHEGCHFLCMDGARRACLDRDAGGDPAEEDAVCYLQILLADRLPGMGRQRMLADMDAWGYSFRLGSAGRWFQADAAEARAWLGMHGLLPLPEAEATAERGGVPAWAA